jgi:hypothetical protein
LLHSPKNQETRTMNQDRKEKAVPVLQLNGDVDYPVWLLFCIFYHIVFYHIVIFPGSWFLALDS